VGTWDDVGRYVTGTADGSKVVFWDSVFSDARSFVTVITDGNRSELEPLPSDGYIVGCGAFRVSVTKDDLLAECNFSPRGSDTTQSVILLHPLKHT
jgi:hypothetical protein